MLEVVFVARAQEDLFAAWDRYEQIGTGLGDAFEEAVAAALDQAARFPESAPVYHQPFRRLLVRQFQFGIFYAVEGRRLVVRALLDLRQDADEIQKRLG
jgi:plasmid stabilization system protein ParE